MKYLIKKAEIVHPRDLIKQFTLIRTCCPEASFTEFCKHKNITGMFKNILECLVIKHMIDVLNDSIRAEERNKRIMENFNTTFLIPWATKIIKRSKINYRGKNRRCVNRTKDIRKRVFNVWASNLVK